MFSEAAFLLPEVNNRAFIVLGSDIMVRNMYELFFLRITTALFSWTFLCLEKLFVLLGNWESSLPRGRNYSKLQTKA